MEEKIFFNEGGVTVSNSRFVVRGQTYAMSEITSIKIARIDPSIKGPLFFLLLSLSMVIKPGEYNILYTLPGIILFFSSLIIGLVWLFRIKPKYKIIWDISSGRTSAFANKDKEYIKNVVTALYDARAHPINHEPNKRN